MNRLGIAGAVLVVRWLERPPSRPGDICAVFTEKPGWYAASRSSAARWGVPEAVQLAVIYQESGFRARGVAATAAVVAFLLNGLGATLPWLAPLRPLSPFAWFLDGAPPLARGLDLEMAAAPAVILALFWGARISFRRRDLAA